MDHSMHSIDHDHHAHGTADPMAAHNHDHMTTTHGAAASGDMDVCAMSGHAGHGAMGMMMSMSFHFGYCETILFDFWTISTVGGLIGSMIGIFFMAAIYESLKYYREYLFWRSYKSLPYQAVGTPGEKGVVPEDNRVVHMVGEVIHKQPSTMFSLAHGYQTLLHIIQMFLSYCLMLIFMTYNVWLCLATVVGAAVGYFLFGWKKSVIFDTTEHCH